MLIKLLIQNLRVYILYFFRVFFGHGKPMAAIEVFKQSFWMRAFGSPTPKRTTLWSNSSGIRYFCTSKKARGKSKGPKLADTYIDKAGKKRYKGNGNLRKSQFQPHWFMTVIIPMALSVYVCEYLEYCTMMAPS